MPQPLAVSYTNRGGATDYQVFRMNNGTLTAVGNPGAQATFGTLASDSGLSSKMNFAAQFGDEIYASHGFHTVIYNPSTGDWDSALDWGGGFPPDRDGGLFVGKNDSGGLRLIGIRSSSGNINTAVCDTPGGAWSSVVDTGINVINTAFSLSDSVIFDNKVFICASGEVIVVDIATRSATEHTVGTSGLFRAAGLVVGGGRVFVLQNNRSANDWTNIYEWVGGTFVQILDGSINQAMPRVNSAGNPNDTRWLGAFYDEPSDSLIVHGWQAAASSGTINPGGSGWVCVRVPLSTLTESDLTSTVVPVGLRAPGGPNPINDMRWYFDVDTDTFPTSPTTYIWVSHNDGPLVRHQWNGIGSVMTSGGTGGDRSIALSHNPNGGGERYYDGSSTGTPAYHVEEVQARVPLVGGTRVFLRGYQIDETGGSPTPTDEIVGLYWGVGQQTPDNLASISNAVKVSGPGSAPSISGNKIQNFTFDGTSIYSVDWDAVSDGLSGGDIHSLMPHVEV